MGIFRVKKVLKNHFPQELPRKIPRKMIFVCTNNGLQKWQSKSNATSCEDLLLLVTYICT
jgi:hypothetical protein